MEKTAQITERKMLTASYILMIELYLGIENKRLNLLQPAKINFPFTGLVINKKLNMRRLTVTRWCIFFVAYSL